MILETFLKIWIQNKECKLAYDLFLYRIIKVIGSYITALNGLDNLVFTAAIGENVPKLREDICNQLKFLGLKLNKNKNNKNNRNYFFYIFKSKSLCYKNR